MKGTISRARQDESEIHAEQVRMLYEGAPAAALANAVNAAILAFLLWDVIPHAPLQGWLGAMCLVQVSRLALVRLYRRLSQPEYDHVHTGNLRPSLLHFAGWDQWYLASVAASGLVWGAAGF